MGSTPLTDIFICRAGERSQRLGNALRDHLSLFIPGQSGSESPLNLFISGDIAKGSRWFGEVENQLDKAGAGSADGPALTG